MSLPSPERESTENQEAGPKSPVSASPVAFRRKFKRTIFLASSSPSSSSGEDKQDADSEQPSLSEATGQASASKAGFAEVGQKGLADENEAHSLERTSSQVGSQEASAKDEGDVDEDERALLRFLKEGKDKLEKRRMEVSSEEEESRDKDGSQEPKPSETDDESDHEDEDLNAGTQRVMRETAKGDRLGRGSAPEIKPLEDVLSKIRQRTAELTKKVKATPRVVLPCAPKARHAAAVKFLTMPTKCQTIPHEQQLEAADGKDDQKQGADWQAAESEEPADKPRKKEKSQQVHEFQETEGPWAVGFTPIDAAFRGVTEVLLGEVDALNGDLEIVPDDEGDAVQPEGPSADDAEVGAAPHGDEGQTAADPLQQSDGASAVPQDHPEDPQTENRAAELQRASQSCGPAPEAVDEEEPEDVSLAGGEGSEDKDGEEEELLSEEEISVDSSSESESEEEAEEDNQRAQRKAVRELVAAERAERRRHRKHLGGYVEDEAEMSEDEGHSDDSDAEADDEAEHEKVLRDLIGHQKDRRKDEKLRAQLHAKWLADEHERAINNLADGVRHGFRKRRGPSYLGAEDGSFQDARRRRAAAEEDEMWDHQPESDREAESGSDDDDEQPEEVPEFNPDDISDDEAKAKLILYQESKKLAVVSESAQEEWDGNAHMNEHYQELISSSEERTEMFEQGLAKLNKSKTSASGCVKQERVVRATVSLLGMSSTTSKLVPQNNSRSYVFGSSESQNAPQLGSEALVVDARTSFAGIKRRAAGGPPLVERKNLDQSLLSVLNPGEEGPQEKLPDMARILSHFGRKRPKPALWR